jgi:hypothetical protein
MYNHLVNNRVKVTQEIWRMKLPLKIKIFLWFLKKRLHSQRIIWPKEIKMVVRFASFAVAWKP